VPRAGNTVVIANGHTVTVGQRAEVGVSGVEGTVALDLQATGALTVASGGFLSVRGDVVYTPGAGNRSVAVTLNPGATWEFDSSRAGAAVHYRFGPLADNALRPFVANGTASQRVIVRSNAAGGAGYFSQQRGATVEHWYGTPFQAA
jgi:hypothetical protein